MTGCKNLIRIRLNPEQNAMRGFSSKPNVHFAKFIRRMPSLARKSELSIQLRFGFVDGHGFTPISLSSTFLNGLPVFLHSEGTLLDDVFHHPSARRHGTCWGQ